MKKLLKKPLKKILIKAGLKIDPAKQYLYSSVPPYKLITNLTEEELLSLMRHEAHRIEKSIYNDIFDSKFNIYNEKAKRIKEICKELERRDTDKGEPTLVWAKQILAAFNDLKSNFIEPYSKAPQSYDLSKAQEYVDFVQHRRSVRVWHDKQPSKDELEALADQCIDAARWAPSSGNRQPWQFKVLTEQQDKDLLKKIKEEHCTSAPLLIFIGMDRRLYGSLSLKQFETALYIDAGAAIMNMVGTAQSTGMGTCWNHFGRDMIDSREVNKKIYLNFCEHMAIPDYIEPVAILAIGAPAYMPPTPARVKVQSLKIV